LLTRLSADAARERAAASAQPEVFGQPAPTYPTDGGVRDAAPPSVRPMTVDDVVVRTIGLLALVVVAAGAVWTLVPIENALGLALPAAMVGLVLGLVISFARVTNPFVIGAYAVVEGVFVGAVSHAFNEMFPGIVMQAVIATLGVFLLMAFLYKSGTIRATPRFVRFMVGALVGCAAVILINLVITLFTGSATILRDGGPIAIIVSLVFIVVAALSFILSFHEVEEGARLGLPQRYAWACAFGILVSLVWLYLEVLRLLSYFSSE
jgi:uncharacterized YccA/Bax inhibitor family protein